MVGRRELVSLNTTFTGDSDQLRRELDQAFRSLQRATVGTGNYARQVRGLDQVTKQYARSTAEAAAAEERQRRTQALNRGFAQTIRQQAVGTGEYARQVRGLEQTTRQYGASVARTAQIEAAQTNTRRAQTQLSERQRRALAAAAQAYQSATGGAERHAQQLLRLTAATTEHNKQAAQTVATEQRTAQVRQTSAKAAEQQNVAVAKAAREQRRANAASAAHVQSLRREASETRKTSTETEKLSQEYQKSEARKKRINRETAAFIKAQREEARAARAATREKRQAAAAERVDATAKQRNTRATEANTRAVQRNGRAAVVTTLRVVALTRAVRGLRGTMSSLAAAAGLVGVARVFSQQTLYATRIEQTSRALAVMTDDLIIVERASRRAGLAWDELRILLTEFEYRLQLAREGVRNYERAFRRIGIDPADLQIENLADTLLLVARGLETVDAAAQAGTLKQLFGEGGVRAGGILASEEYFLALIESIKRIDRLDRDQTVALTNLRIAWISFVDALGTEFGQLIVTTLPELTDALYTAAIGLHNFAEGFDRFFVRVGEGYRYLRNLVVDFGLENFNALFGTDFSELPSAREFLGIPQLEQLPEGLQSPLVLTVNDPRLEADLLEHTFYRDGLNIAIQATIEGLKSERRELRQNLRYLSEDDTTRRRATFQLKLYEQVQQDVIRRTNELNKARRDGEHISLIERLEDDIAILRRLQLQIQETAERYADIIAQNAALARNIAIIEQVNQRFDQLSNTFANVTGDVILNVRSMSDALRFLGREVAKIILQLTVLDQLRYNLSIGFQSLGIGNFLAGIFGPSTLGLSGGPGAPGLRATDSPLGRLSPDGTYSDIPFGGDIDKPGTLPQQVDSQQSLERANRRINAFSSGISELRASAGASILGDLNVTVSGSDEATVRRGIIDMLPVIRDYIINSLPTELHGNTPLRQTVRSI